MRNGKKGFSLIEVLLSAATLAVIALFILPNFAKKRENVTTLSSFSSCDGLANYFLTNITSAKAATVVRNYYPTVAEPSADPTWFPGDSLCGATRNIACDSVQHFNAAPLAFGNFQNIRSAATWAGAVWENPTYRSAGNCTARAEFRKSNSTLPNIRSFLPHELGVAEFNALVSNAQDSNLVESVTFEITQISSSGAPVNCGGGARHFVRPNNAYSFNVSVEVSYLEKVIRGPAAAPKTCRAQANVAYEFERSPSPLQVALSTGTTPPLPFANFQTPPVPPRTCNSTIPTSFSPDRAVILLSLSGMEPGSLPICFTSSRPDATSAWVDTNWTLCSEATLLGTLQATVLTNRGTIPRSNSPWQLDLRWGQPGPGLPKVPVGQYRIVMRAIDSAGNCTPPDSSPPCLAAERTFTFQVNRPCSSYDLSTYCPDIIVLDECGDNCGRGTQDPNCPDPATYFSCEKRCGTACRNTTCTPEVGNPYTGAQAGTRNWVQAPGDNMCPAQNSYCSSVTVQKPCGLGACPIGTKDGCDGKCAGEENECTGANTCDGLWSSGLPRPGCDAGGNRLPGGSEPVGTDGCNGDYVPFCPPTDHYCANTVVRDQCNRPCPTGTMQDLPAAQNFCCDRCPSGSLQFESLAECTSPSSYVPPAVPPATCNQLLIGSDTRCFVPP